MSPFVDVDPPVGRRCIELLEGAGKGRHVGSEKAAFAIGENDAARRDGVGAIRPR
jgi:hypothetical protein